MSQPTLVLTAAPASRQLVHFTCWHNIPVAHVLMLPESSWCSQACKLLLQGGAHGALLRSSVALLQVSLMDDQGNTKDDLGLPKGTDDAEKLAAQIKKDFDDGKELQVTVLKVGSWQPQSRRGLSRCSLRPWG